MEMMEEASEFTPHVALSETWAMKASTDLKIENECLKKHVERQRLQLLDLSEELKEVYTALKDTQFRMYAHEKLACIGEMAAGIAHEINNPLTYVMFNLSSFESELEALRDCIEQASDASQDKMYREMRQIVEQCATITHDSSEGIERIQEIVRNLKDFAYDQQPVLEYFDIHRNIETSLKLVWNELKHKVDVVRHFGAVPKLLGYPKQMNQVFINLFMNAAQAVTGRGQLTITTELKNENEVWIHVEDNGGGIPRAIQDRIFDTFFTTKPSGQGTGLGLGVVREIVKRHGGALTFSSEEGRGTVFSIGLLVHNPELEKRLGK